MPVTMRRAKRSRRVVASPLGTNLTQPRGMVAVNNDAIKQMVEEQLEKNGYSRAKDPFVKGVNNVITQYEKIF